MQSKHMDRFLKKDRTRFSKLFGKLLLCLLSIVFFRIVPITSPRQAQKIWLESLYGCALSAQAFPATRVRAGTRGPPGARTDRRGGSEG